MRRKVVDGGLDRRSPTLPPTDIRSPARSAAMTRSCNNRPSMQHQLQTRQPMAIKQPENCEVARRLKTDSLGKAIRLLWEVDRTKVKQHDYLRRKEILGGGDLIEGGGWRAPCLDDPLVLQLAGLARVPALGLRRLGEGFTLDLAREWGWFRDTNAPDYVSFESRRQTAEQLRKLFELSSQLSSEIRNLSSHVLDDLALASILPHLRNGTDPPGPPGSGGYDF